jgi:hypothetical protein
MDAIRLLKRQHRQIEALLDDFEVSESEVEKRALLDEIADDIAVHATVEERLFYPIVRERETEEQIEETFDDHLEIKKLLLDALGEPGRDGRVAALRGAVLHHVDEEENFLFPTAMELLEADALEALGQRMEAEAELIRAAGAPRRLVKVEIEPPAVQP